MVTLAGADLPGVRFEGRYVSFRTSRSVGFVTGVVSSGSGPIAALVQTQSLPFVGISGADGVYRLLTEAGTAALIARVPSTALFGTGSVPVAAGGQAVLDILLTGAQTTATVVPTDGSTGLPTSTHVELHTAAAMQAGSITASSVRLLKLPGETAVAARTGVEPGLLGNG